MKTIDNAEAAVSAVEGALTQFDDLTAAVKAKTVEISTLQAEHESNTADHSADFAKRLKIHSANASALVLHQADLLTLQSNADGQKRKVLALGKATGDGLQSLSSQLQAVARVKAKELVYEHFDPQQISPFLQTLIFSSKIVRAVPYVPALYRDDESLLSQLRGIRANVFTPLKAFVENSGLELDEPEPEEAAADVAPSAMAEPVAV
jgi:hypothetical protein